MRVRKRDPRPLEGSMENAWCSWVKKQGGVTRKMNGLGFRSWPDRQAFKPYVKRSLWVEFKRFGEGPTDAQKEIHKLLRTMGQKVVICDNLADAIREYERHGCKD